MATTNPITGDAIQSKVSSKEYIDNYDRIFRMKDKVNSSLSNTATENRCIDKLDSNLKEVNVLEEPE